MGPEPGTDEAFERATVHALRWLGSLAIRRVPSSATADEVAAVLGTDLPGPGEEPAAVIDRLAAAVEPGLMASASGRFYGWVMGGTLPAAAAADWLVTAWDQNAGMRDATPGVVAVEEVAAGWLLQLLGLPAGSSVGFASGATMANFTCLAAARGRVLQRVGWDVGADGLSGAPRIRVFVGNEGHGSVDVALRYLGFGTPGASPSITVVPADDQGRIVPGAVADAVAAGPPGPVIVAVQAGNVNTGAIDPIAAVRAAAPGAWIHVDGAFGLWAGASPALRSQVAGVELADSWATDGHKWLNVPYDSGLVFVADPAAHRAATTLAASYLTGGEGERNGYDWAPEASRRARAFPIWGALRSLGRSGVADLVDRCCAQARRFAEGLADVPGAEIRNEVTLNQVLVRFTGAEGDRTAAVAAAVQREGTCWAGTTTWHGAPALRISVSGWSTTQADVDRSLEAIRKAAS